MRASERRGKASGWKRKGEAFDGLWCAVVFFLFMLKGKLSEEIIIETHGGTRLSHIFHFTKTKSIS